MGCGLEEVRSKDLSRWRKESSQKTCTYFSSPEGVIHFLASHGSSCSVRAPRAGTLRPWTWPSLHLNASTWSLLVDAALVAALAAGLAGLGRPRLDDQRCWVPGFGVRGRGSFPICQAWVMEATCWRLCASITTVEARFGGSFRRHVVLVGTLAFLLAASLKQSFLAHT